MCPEWTLYKMVEGAGQRTNTGYLVDFIQITLNPAKVKSVVFKDLYEKRGLSANQIATFLGCSKTIVLDRLRRSGVSTQVKRQSNPQNYLVSEAPYGFSKRDGKLTPNKREMRVIRLIVHLRTHQKLSYVKIGKELEQRGIKNRRGRVSWLYCSVKKYFHRWKEKI